MSCKIKNEIISPSFLIIAPPFAEKWFEDNMFLAVSSVSKLHVLLTPKLRDLSIFLYLPINWYNFQMFTLLI